MITPMVARLVCDPFDRAGWFFEWKWDGFRAIAEADAHGGVSLYGRNKNPLRFPLIGEAVRELKRSVILDGEIVALDDKGLPRFEWLVSRGRQKGVIVYFVFDLLMLDGRDLRQEPLLERKVMLAGLLEKKRKHKRLVYVDHVEDHGLESFADALALGFEGIVAKDSKSPYVEGPRMTGHWLEIKSKNYERQEKIEFHPRKVNQ